MVDTKNKKVQKMREVRMILEIMLLLKKWDVITGGQIKNNVGSSNCKKQDTSKYNLTIGSVVILKTVVMRFIFMYRVKDSAVVFRRITRGINANNNSVTCEW